MESTNPSPLASGTAHPRGRRRQIARLTIAVAGGLALTAAMTTPAGAVPAPPGGGCAAVHVITARASTEPPGEGITGALVTQIVNASAQTVSRAAVSYPATLTNYASSSAQGVAALRTQLTSQVQACPGQQIVLAGYSQGGHVVLDVLGGGGGGTLGPTTPPISSAIADRVSAVVTFGEPRHVVGQPYNRGTSFRNGLFPRTSSQLQVLSGYAGRIRSWCDFNDLFCASGLSTVVHLTYLSRYQNTAASFVLGRIGG